jgi:uncharacterized membrane protein YtjA (UPF0391 family)
LLDFPVTRSPGLQFPPEISDHSRYLLRIELIERLPRALSHRSAAKHGFGGIAVIAVDIAKILFLVFIVLFVLTLIVHLVRGRGPPPP